MISYNDVIYDMILTVNGPDSDASLHESADATSAIGTVSGPIES